ncbi:uncharacterized protein TNCV_918391 [Trichonephila clavipes]|nr:uncharacterized protein TNCV_918391 [Trichonephila clavipes]
MTCLPWLDTLTTGLHLTGHDFLCAHLFRFNLVTSPICILCDTGQDMTAAHLDECSALNDLNCIGGELTGGGQSPPTSLPLPPTSREDLGLDGYLKYPHAAKALYVYKHLCLLRDSNLGLTEHQSASLTTIPYGRLLKLY